MAMPPRGSNNLVAGLANNNNNNGRSNSGSKKPKDASAQLVAALAFTAEETGWDSFEDSDESYLVARAAGPADDYYWGNVSENGSNHNNNSNANNNSISNEGNVQTRWDRTNTETTDTTWFEAHSEHPTTPSGAARTDENGVLIPSGLKEFFGLEFLPFGVYDGESLTFRNNVKMSSTDLKRDEDDDDYLQGLGGTDLNASAHRSRGKRVKKRLSNIKKSVQKAASSVRRRARGKSQGEEMIEETSEELAYSNARCASELSPVELKSEIDFQLTHLKTNQITLEGHKQALQAVSSETDEVLSVVQTIASRMNHARQEVTILENALKNAMQALEHDRAMLTKQQAQLERLERQRIQVEQNAKDSELAVKQQLVYVSSLQQTASDIRSGKMVDANKQDHLTRSVSSPFPERQPLSPKQVSNHSNSLSIPQGEQVETPRTDNFGASKMDENTDNTNKAGFLRVGDLDLSALLQPPLTGRPNMKEDTLMSLDENTEAILKSLNKYAYDVVTDEGSRWVATRDSERLLSKREPGEQLPGDEVTCPKLPWHYASDKDILVWVGQVDDGGYCNELPVIKARGIVKAPPKDVLDLFIDSSRVKEYNKMSLGRQDECIFQEGTDSSAEDSQYGCGGSIKVVKSMNKPPLIRKTIEMRVLLHARRLELGEGEGYLAVSRSAWENSTATHDGTDSIRSDMLMGVNLLRPLPGDDDDEVYCELTTITHVFSPGVPQVLAKKMAPTVAANFIRDVQAIWKK